MDNSRIILLMIVCCLIFAVAIIFRRQLKAVFLIIIQAAMGMAGIGIVNLVLGIIGIASPVGINLLNMFVTGILGIPGIVMLYVVGYIL